MNQTRGRALDIAVSADSKFLYTLNSAGGTIAFEMARQLTTAGETVSLKFEGAGPTNPTTVTDVNGNFHLDNIPVGHYLKLQVKGHGYNQSKAVTVHKGSTTTVHFSPRIAIARPSVQCSTDQSRASKSAVACMTARLSLIDRLSKR